MTSESSHFFMNETIAIVGGAGYIGSNLSHRLFEMGYPHIVIDDLSSGKRERIHANIPFYETSIHNISEVSEILRHESISVVVHLAGLKLVSASDLNPESYEEVNVLGTGALLQAMKNSDVSKIIFSSTAAVYGNSEESVSETSMLEPISQYGKTKLAAENLIKNAAEENSFVYIIFRYFNVAGGKFILNSDDSVMNILSECINNSNTFTIFGVNHPTPDGTCMRDFIHVDDLISAKITAIESLLDGRSNTNETFNLGSGKGSTILELIKIFEEVSGLKIETKNGGSRENEIPYSCSDISKSSEVLGWKPQYSIVNIVSDYIQNSKLKFDNKFLLEGDE